MRIHFIAIGGSAMHNLAIALHNKGYIITGSDDTIFEPSKSRLEARGLLPSEFGWFEDKISSEIDAVILGMHAKADNPELLKAKALGLKVYSYPEFLFEQSKHKTRVVIGGSHGKTTITSMILHVMNYHNRDVDFMVGAQLEGFDVMVKLTDESDFIVLEGDEYLSSPLDPRPKFHLYKPNIALLSGIAWDHVNVFPTMDDYIKQFKIFIDSIVEGGSLTFNAEDKILAEIVADSQNQIRKLSYNTPDYFIENGQTYINTEEGELPVEVFGAHNLNNLEGAKWICQHMGIDETDFYEAITSFKGASKRLELIGLGKNSAIFKDFAHSPSKVKATTHAVKSQFLDRELIACIELHTYSSLDPVFIKEYKDTLHYADEAIVFYSSKALEIKKKTPIPTQDIRDAFNKNIKVFSNSEELKEHLMSKSLSNTNLLFMSSGNYGGLVLKDFVEKLV